MQGGNLLYLAIHMGVYWKMNNMNNGSSVTVTNFIEFKTEKDFIDFKGDRL